VSSPPQGVHRSREHDCPNPDTYSRGIVLPPRAYDWMELKRGVRTLVLRLRTWQFAGLCLLLFLVFSVIHSVSDIAVQRVLGIFGARLVPIYSVDTDRKDVAISFDAVWGVEFTDELLAVLAENDVKTTFFLGGFWLEKYPRYVRKIALAGHEIGNHTYSHPHLNSLSRDEIRNELTRNHAIIQSLSGQSPFLLRPPFGEYSDKVIKVARELGYLVIQWSIDSLDWKNVSSDTIVERVMSRITPGDIVLFHNNGANTLPAVRKLIPLLKKRGFRIVPISELVYRDNYYIEQHSGRQRPLPKRGD